MKSENFMFGVIALLLVLLLFSSTSPVSYVVNDNISSVIISPLDVSTGAVNTIDYAHHEVHEGSHYNYKDFYSIIKDTNKSFLLVTPDSSEEAHLVFGVEAVSSTIVYEIFENVTYSSNGTLEPVRNRNRNFANGNLVLLYEDPIMVSNGTNIVSGVFGAGKNSGGGGTRDTEEIVLRTNTSYLIIVTEQNIQTTLVNIMFDWYEHTPKG